MAQLCPSLNSAPRFPEAPRCQAPEGRSGPEVAISAPHLDLQRPYMVTDQTKHWKSAFLQSPGYWHYSPAPRGPPWVQTVQDSPAESQGVRIIKITGRFREFGAQIEDPWESWRPLEVVMKGSQKIVRT